MIETKGLNQALKKIADMPKQVRFATSQAINDTAKDVQKFTIDQLLPSVFTLRSKGTPWQKPGQAFGFNIKFANKQTLTATVGSRAPWLKHQEEGGTRSASGHREAVPTPAWKPKPQLMLREKKPRHILAGRKIPPGLVNKPFKLKDSIVVRATKAANSLIRLFTLTSSVRIKPVLNFKKRATAVVNAVFPAHFTKRLAAALKTAK